MKKILAFIKCVLYAGLLVGSQYLVAILMVMWRMITTDLPYEEIVNTVFGADVATISYLSAILLIGFIWLLSRIFRKKFSDFIDWGKNVRGMITYACVLVGIGGNFWTTVVMSSIFSQEAVEEYNAASSNMSVSASMMTLIGVAVLVPIMEEIVFRGIILNRFSRVMPVEMAIILQGLIFGLMHGDIIWITYAVFMGLVLGYIKVCTNSLKASIAMHMAYNIASPIGGMITYSFMGTGNAELVLVLTGTILMISGLITIYKYQPE
ncbi:MAG: CPBP family intramembrane metalloprotease [Clostridia bacterium]|nr:CPBP family intramembrane metalloprotease [Clostridia bacterium]